jgi:hypothetical protein
MDRRGHTVVTAVVDDATVTRTPMVKMGSGYVNRAMHLFPQQGSHGPWRLDQDYKLDRTIIGKDPIEDSALVFSDARPSAAVMAVAGSHSASAAG